MVPRVNLNMDVLRTFVTGSELGSFSKAAQRLGRSQSAISTQLRRLEEQAGKPLFKKSGRGLALTTAGESLLSYAKRILELNDEAIDGLRDGDVEGWVRLGIPQDFAEGWLTSLLGRFARAHPKVRVEVRAEQNVLLMDRLRDDELDLALAWGGGNNGVSAERLIDLPMVWVGRPDWDGIKALGGEPLSLVAFEPPCVFRSAGIEALDRAGIAWRLAFTSPSLAGLWAATGAGLGVTLRTTVGLPNALVVLKPGVSGLPGLPKVSLTLCKTKADPAVNRLCELLRETIAEQIKHR
ncbi:MAG: LysR family transcriptional regulator [Verrucomicrobia bacterium]|nr:LysR family transcriptional regulator [Verrucomicrobiota bacterium]